jgi:hypothetical protein
MAKTKRELERDIAEALACRGQGEAHARMHGLSEFHRANIPSSHWEELEVAIANGEAVVRKVDRATKVSEGRDTNYYYRGMRIDQDLSVPTGYYGRWRTRGFSDDSLQHLLNAIDARNVSRA